MKKLIFLFISLWCINQVYAQTRSVVAQDGSGNFKTVQEAINAAPANSSVPLQIFVKKGTYKERVVVPVTKTNIALVGEDASKTIITFDNFASKLDSAGRALGTSRTASFYVYGAGFSAKNITFENSSGPVGQALAIFVDADKAVFYNCRFLGFQDTIYTHGSRTRQYYKDCYIEGTTDFIFGDAVAMFENCHIYCKKGGHYITAAATDIKASFGYVFKNCKIDGDAPDGSFTLGRPWRPNAKVVYLNCNLSKVISGAGWDNWRNPENEKTAYFAEYKSTGPGNQPNERVSWSHQLTGDEAKIYTKKLILNDWEPSLP
jgi:pectinesterase